MKILILGGTQFLGRHLVSSAQARGHEVTLFNRGKTNSDLFPEVEKIRGDRDGGLKPLKGHRWDAVLDVSGYVPRLVGDSATLLKDCADRYVFISTISVYADFTKPLGDESARLIEPNDPSTEEVTAETYGGLKVLCEAAAGAAMPGRLLTLRPGYIVGPWDSTDRFTCWVRRMGQGGHMLAPGRPEAPIQFIDVRDLSKFTIGAIERQMTGVFNMTGPASPLTWGTLFKQCETVCRAGTELNWVSEEFLSDQKVEGTDLPLWQASVDQGVMQADCGRAIREGLQYRGLAETILDTRVWDRQHGQPKAGLSLSRESELLEAWRQGREA